MLKINLLPPYIYEGNKRRNVALLWALILAAVVGACVFSKLRIDAETEARRQETEALRPNADEADRLAREATDIQSQNAGLKAKRDFVTASNEHISQTYPPLFDNVRNWTIDRVLYRSVVPQGQAVAISAHAPSLSRVGHYMLAMERNPNITGLSIAMNSVPGFGPNGPIRGQQQGGFGGGGNAEGPRLPGGHDFNVTLALSKPIPAAPVYPAGGGGQQAGAGGFPGGGGMGGGPMGGGMGPGGPPMGSGGMQRMMGPGGGGAGGGVEANIAKDTE
jgi:Tfp pilus assembly protein PilN